MDKTNETAAPEQTKAAEAVQAPEDGSVLIHLFKDNDRYKDPVFVQINGKAYLIQRGVDVRVPRAVAEVLENQAKAREEAATRSEQLAGEFEQRTREIFGV